MNSGDLSLPYSASYYASSAKVNIQMRQIQCKFNTFGELLIQHQMIQL